MGFEDKASTGIGKADVKPKSRIAGLDVLRTFAVSCVILTHAISYSGVLDGDTKTLAFPVYLILRFAAITGVPLFIMLSGYLCSSKKLSRAYYVKIIPILISYFVIATSSVICTNIVSPGTFSTFTAILGVLDFTAHGYAWYAEMYIGLFLLIPFLNILYDSLATRGRRLALIGTLVFMTVLPSTLPSFHLFGTRLDVLPDYWTAIYPLTYYFIGAYLKDYKIRLGFINKIIFALSATAVPVLLCFIKTRIDGSYAWYMMNGFSSFTAVICGIAYFTLFSDMKPPRALSFVARQISLCSFEMYLFSFLTDNFMNIMLSKLGVTRGSVLLLLTFAGSFVLSLVLSLLFRLVSVPVSGFLMKKALGKVEN